ncbi:glycosyltransferase [Profundibacterium mesophilum]|uniref:Phosphatidylinositol glycan class A n=1 Tax=Profundibacterium mesophilum KAUST100406-0324 TaxID=1037889 RepID=A0A921TBM5_9RHOB|nr:glycosyltransferase [Profundibacterium mesophilum]KAF0675900.1 phosphatidylinositol glycan class A [Profundibacterium mesophilum KAUST100406-0324]
MTASSLPRILLLSATPRSDRGGVQRMMDRLVEELPPRGLTPVRAGPDETPDSGTRIDLEVGAGRGGRPTLSALPGAGRSLLQLARLLARVRPAVVNLHFMTGAAAYLLALRPVFGYRLVFSGHGADLLEPTPGMAARLPGFLAAADAVTVVSGELAQVARAHGVPEDRLHMIPNGADTHFWCPGPPEAEPGRIVASGRLLPNKGFDILLEALSGLPDAQCTIAGEGADRAELEGSIARLGLGARVHLAGHLEPEALRRALRRASLFAMPSRREGMPLALIEALACGTPAAATAIGGIPEVLTEATGIVVPPEDASAFRAALARGLDHGGPLSRSAARARAELFSDEACYSRYAEIFRTLAAR